MALRVHRGDHPTLLVDALCDLLEVPPADPFVPEVVAVPTRGIERWLTQQIADTFATRGVGDGVCANVEFPFPGRLVRDVLVQAPQVRPMVEGWRRREVVRHLDELIEANRHEEWLWLLARFIAEPGPADGSTDTAQRLAAAQKIARLFATYARRRPDMIRAWAGGNDIGPDGETIPGHAAWQPRLWRLLRAAVGEPSLPEVLPGALDAIRAGAVELALPPRISVYGLTAVDPMDLAVLDALGATTEVHLFTLHPSPGLWGAVAAATDDAPQVTRAEDPTRSAAVHPILQSWAQETRELQIVLASSGIIDPNGEEAGRPNPATLLAHLQHDIRTNRPAGNLGDGVDRSLQIHVCHGTQRQVEVMRDAILHLLADDPTLEPRDIVIMTPDLETYAPLIEAAFPSTSGPLPDLRVRIADRAPSRTNPLIRFTGTVLDLAASRVEASRVREFIALPEVRRRFRIDPDSAGLMDDLIEDANVRWGLDADHRERSGAGGRSEHTWHRGIDRTLAGVYFSDDPVRLIDDLAPVHGIEGQDADAAGLLAQIVDRIGTAVDLLREERPSSQWPAALGAAVRMLALPERFNDWQWDQLDRIIDDTFAPGDPLGADPVIGLAAATLLVAPWSDDRPSPLHHRTGDITVCSLVPMRSVPYRVVCLLGMDDERFPRSSRRDGDDLLIDHEIVGDHDRGAEDRQLLLDAVMAAGDHLVVTYAGRDELTNVELPPSVPIAELIDVVRTMVGPDGLESARTRHPLQGFSLVNFTPTTSGPWGFDPMQHDGAIALSRRNEEPDLHPPIVLPDDLPGELPLDDLVSFLEHPARFFLRSRFGFTVPKLDDGSSDTLPTGLEALERWAVADRILRGIIAGYHEDDLIAAEVGSDWVPAGALATDGIDEAGDLAERVWAAATDEGFTASSRQVAGTVALPEVLLIGSVTVESGAPQAGLATPSRMKAKYRLAAYARLLFLSALAPEHAWRSVIVAKRESGPTITVVTMEPLGATAEDRAARGRRGLNELVALLREAWHTPIPVFTETSYAWHSSEDWRRDRAVEAAWLPDGYRFSPESRDPANRMLFPQLVTVQDLEASDFPEYADRLWGPILSVIAEGST